MKRSLTLLAVVVAVAAGAGYWYAQGKLPQREGEVAMAGLQAPVSVRYDSRGVPHLQAQNEADLYRALGYLHAQDRLFQMEIMRRLARGELAEVLGDKLLPTDTLFRSLRIREQAALMARRQDPQSPAALALQAYLDGVNRWQASHPKPVEFDLLGITPRPFTAEDTLSIAGYLAYSFAAAFRTEPALTYIRDQLGPDYLNIFDLGWQPEGAWANRWRRPTGAASKAWPGSATKHWAMPAFRSSRAAMPGPSPVAAHAVAGRCWQATRTSVLQYRRCGTRPNCRHPASTCTATSRRSTRSPCSATTATSAGA